MEAIMDDIDIEMLDNIPNNMTRYPSNEDFDKDSALKSSFGLFSSQSSFPMNKGFNSESDQLGVMVENSAQNEQERISFEQEKSEYFWSQTDKTNPNRRIIGIKEHFADLSTENHLMCLKYPDPIPKAEWYDLELGLPKFKTDQNEQDDMSCDEEESKYPSNNTDAKETRWNKDDDKRLFATYRALWRKEMLNLKDVITTPLKKNKQYNMVIESVGKQVGWTGKKAMLVKRIKKIFNNVNLSVREKQALTRMYKSQAKEGDVKWEEILYEFPGKTLIFIKEFCNGLTKAKQSNQQAENSSEDEERKDDTI